jgi:hypothetical protein
MIFARKSKKKKNSFKKQSQSQTSNMTNKLRWKERESVLLVWKKKKTNH